MSSDNVLRFSVISGLFIVIFGALVAHVLAAKWDALQIKIVDTGLFFQAFHTVILMVLALLPTQHRIRFRKLSSLFLVVGTIFFSGSLYYFVIFQQHVMVYITPVGGVCLMLGWLVLIAGTFVRRDQVTPHE